MPSVCFEDWHCVDAIHSLGALQPPNTTDIALNICSSFIASTLCHLVEIRIQTITFNTEPQWFNSRGLHFRDAVSSHVSTIRGPSIIHERGRRCGVVATLGPGIVFLDDVPGYRHGGCIARSGDCADREPAGRMCRLSATGTGIARSRTCTDSKQATIFTPSFPREATETRDLHRQAPAGPLAAFTVRFRDGIPANPGTRPLSAR